MNRFTSATFKPRWRFYASMPRGSVALLLFGIGCLFAAVGTCTDLFNLDTSDIPHLFISAVSNGTVSASFAWAFNRGKRALAIVIVCSLIFYITVNKLYPRTPQLLTLEHVRMSIILHALLITLFIVIGYILLVAFIGAEGKRYFAAHTEIELAAGIQRDLVPVVSFDCDLFEAYGISRPSGTVGGDLLDVVKCGESFLAYVADVAGHGVKAGVSMSMIKASVRTRCASTGSDQRQLLELLNQVLYPLTDAQSYATFAFISIGPERALLFSLAGHLPIFHLKSKSGVVEQHSIENFPIAMFPSATFQNGEITAEAGDLLAIVTDGLTEIENRAGDELGYSYIERTLQESQSSVLSDIAGRIIEASERFGVPGDDRTLLLIRLR